MAKTAVITGVAGQDGVYLADFLVTKKYQVVGLVLSNSKRELQHLKSFNLLSKIEIIRGSVLDKQLLEKILRTYRPDEFYNLAGQSSVAKSWEDSKFTFAVNGRAVENILQVIKIVSATTKFFQCSSAEIFGDCKKIITEDNSRFNPLNPYGESKLYAHRQVKKFRDKFGLFACSGILFNHESPLRPVHMVSKKIIRGIVDILNNKSDKIILGNLATKRDWGYAGDFVRAMWLILQYKEPLDFVICTGKTYSIKQFLITACKLAGIKDWKAVVKIDKNLLRKQEVKNMHGSFNRAKKLLEWQPQINFEQLIRLLLDYELNVR